MLCGRIGAFLGATQGQLVGAFFGIHSHIGALIIMVIASSILGAGGAMFGGGVGATTGWLISRVNSRVRSTVAVLLGLLLGPLLGYGVMYPLNYFSDRVLRYKPPGR